MLSLGQPFLKIKFWRDENGWSGTSFAAAEVNQKDIMQIFAQDMVVL